MFSTPTVVLLVVIGVTISLVSGYQEENCRVAGGNCQNTAEPCNNGAYKRGYCPTQAADVRCCVTSAAYQEAACNAINGICQNTDTSCTGGYVSGKCPTQPSYIKCCVEAFQEKPCEDIGGICQLNSNSCPLTYVSGKCPTQASNIKCCRKDAYQETACKNEGGICKFTTSGCSGGAFESGYCPTQPSTVKCCIPTAPSSGGNNCGCGYQYATACTDGPARGAINLANYLKGKFGGRTEIYNCRTVRGGSTTSLHGEGRAVDIYLDKTQGDAAFAHIKQIACANGIQEAIWYREIWTQSGGTRYYGGSHPHLDHVHIGLNKCGADKFNLM